MKNGETEVTIKYLRSLTGLSQARFGERYGIPKRTIEDWERGIRIPPPYVVDLLAFRITVEQEAERKNR